MVPAPSRPVGPGVRRHHEKGLDARSLRRTLTKGTPVLPCSETEAEWPPMCFLSRFPRGELSGFNFGGHPAQAGFGELPVRNRVLFVSKGTSPLEGQQAVPRKYYLATLACLSRAPTAQARRRGAISDPASIQKPIDVRSGVSGPMTSSELSAAEAPLQGTRRRLNGHRGLAAGDVGA